MNTLVHPKLRAVRAFAFVATGAWAADGATGRLPHRTEDRGRDRASVVVDAQGQRTASSCRPTPGTLVVWTVTAANVCDKPADKGADRQPGPGADELRRRLGHRRSRTTSSSSWNRSPGRLDPAALRSSDGTEASNSAFPLAQQRLRPHPAGACASPVGPGQVAMAHRAVASERRVVPTDSPSRFPADG